MILSSAHSNNQKHLLEIVIFSKNITALYSIHKKLESVAPTMLPMYWSNSFYEHIGNVALARIRDFCPYELRAHKDYIVDAISNANGNSEFVLEIPVRDNAPISRREEAALAVMGALGMSAVEFLETDIGKKLINDDEEERANVIGFLKKMGIEARLRPDSGNPLSKQICFVCSFSDLFDLTPLHILDCLKLMIEEINQEMGMIWKSKASSLREQKNLGNKTAGKQ